MSHEPRGINGWRQVLSKNSDSHTCISHPIGGHEWSEMTISRCASFLADFNVNFFLNHEFQMLRAHTISYSIAATLDIPAAVSGLTPPLEFFVVCIYIWHRRAFSLPRAPTCAFGIWLFYSSPSLRIGIAAFPPPDLKICRF